VQRVRSSAIAVLTALLALWASVPRRAEFRHRHAGGEHAHVHLDAPAGSDVGTRHSEHGHRHDSEPEPWEDSHDHDHGEDHGHDHEEASIFTSDAAHPDSNDRAYLSTVALGGEHAHRQNLFVPALTCGAVAIAERGAVLPLAPVAPVIVVARALPATSARGPPSPSLI